MCFSVPSLATHGRAEASKVVVFPEILEWPCHPLPVRLGAVRVTGRSSQPQETWSHSCASSPSTLEHDPFFSPLTTSPTSSRDKNHPSSNEVDLPWSGGVCRSPKVVEECPEQIWVAEVLYTIFLCYIFVFDMREHLVHLSSLSATTLFFPLTP